MSSKVFIIIGKSLAGKTTFLNKLLNDKAFCMLYNIHELVRLTTRKPRPNEVDGVDYHFISKKEYLDNYKGRNDVVISVFNSEFGRLYYITDLSKLEEDKNYITVGDPETVVKFRNILGDRLHVIWLMPPDWEIFKRFSQRDDNADYSDKKYKEIHRRYMDDLKKFNQKSNIFISNINCIILLGVTEVNYELFCEIIKGSCYGNQHHIGIILHGNKPPIPFDTTNNYPVIVRSFRNELLKGEVPLINGRVTINTEKETVRIDGKIVNQD